jgi:hypothetical protein
MRGLASVVAASLLLSGCATNLATTPDRTFTKDSGDALVGVSYALPMAQYDITLTRALSACPEGISATLLGEEIYVPTKGLKFSRKAEAKISYGAGERYTVDYRALQSWIKISGFSFGVYPNGTLKTINASADDQTGEVVKNVAKIGLTVAALSARSPVAPGVLGALSSDANTAQIESDQADAQVASMTASLNTLQALIDRVPPSLASGPRMATLTARRSAMQAKLDAARQRAVEARRRLDVYRRLLGHTERVAMVACSPAATMALAKSDSLKTELETASATLNTATADVTRLTVVANLDAASSAQVTDLDGALTRQNAATAAVEAKTKAKDEVDGGLAAIHTETWPSAFYDRSAVLDLTATETARLGKLFVTRTANIVTAKAFAAWLDEIPTADADRIRSDPRFAGLFDKDKKVIGDPEINLQCQGPAASVETCLAAEAGAWVQFQRVQAGLRPCAAEGADGADCARFDFGVTELDKKNHDPKAGMDKDGGPAAAQAAIGYGRHARDEVLDKGVLIRQPAMAVLWICPGARPTGPLDELAPPCPRSIFKSEAPASTPQLGQLRFLPFRNVAFQSNELALSLREDGSVESFSYKNARAIAAAATAAGADVVDQYKAFKEAQDKKRKDDLTAARAEQIAQIQHQIDLLTKQKELLKLQAAEQPDADKAIKAETAHIEAQTALLSAKLAQLKAEAALAEADGD